ncbi:hypothetical protein B6U99_07390 [Candidatus Geothermarchaeota archaeon ex4572_27]|nr:MAG: hypothetical protein B6U99_07390 [Candidatus Geothermarchaeota archaeon ex4572_27]
MRQAKLTEFFKARPVEAERLGGPKDIAAHNEDGLEERFNELVDRLRRLRGHAHLAFVNRSLDAAIYVPMPESFEEFKGKVGGEARSGYRFVGVCAFTPNGGIKWLDSKLRPIPEEPEEVATVSRNLRRRVVSGG